jgi:hypothetical protein
MGLEVVAVPETESELALAVCVLQAHAIPHFVHGGAFGALWPGLQIAAYNARCIMVPAVFTEEAREALADLVCGSRYSGDALPAASAADHPDASASPSRHAWRNLLEVLLAGWFVPRRDGTAR